MSKNKTQLDKEIANLPSHYREMFSDDFIVFLAALRLHDFSIQRADEALMNIRSKQDLWPELSHPSVWIYSVLAPIDELRKAQPGSIEHTRYSNEVIHANLSEQRRLLALLHEFYSIRSPASFQSGLILETIELGETCIRSQGASIRLLEDEDTQRQWLIESQHEMGVFAEFLMNTSKVANISH